MPTPVLAVPASTVAQSVRPTALEFLRQFHLEVLHNALQAHHGTLQLDHLLQMGPADLDRMNIKSTGMRQRFFSAISIANSNPGLQFEHQPPPCIPPRSAMSTMSAMNSDSSRGEEISMTELASLWDDAVQQDDAEPLLMQPERESDHALKQLASSTSTLYINATISKPDMAQVIFCVSALMHDLVEEAEGIGQLSEMLADNAPASSCGKADARYALWKPRAIFALPGKRSRTEYETEQPGSSSDVPSEEDIRECIDKMHSQMNFSPGCLVVSMIYIERLRRAVGAELLASTWQPTLLIATIVAQKMWEDRLSAVTDLTSFCPELTAARLRRLEIDFLDLMNYNITVSASVYTTWYFRLVEFCEQKGVRMRPLSQEEAVKLEIVSQVYADAMAKDSSKKKAASSPAEGPSTSGRRCFRGRAVLN